MSRLNETQIEVAARKLCLDKGLDPEKLISILDVVDGCRRRVPKPRWVIIAENVRKHIEIAQAVEYAEKQAVDESTPRLKDKDTVYAEQILASGYRLRCGRDKTQGKQYYCALYSPEGFRGFAILTDNKKDALAEYKKYAKGLGETNGK